MNLYVDAPTHYLQQALIFISFYPELYRWVAVTWDLKIVYK